MKTKTYNSYDDISVDLLDVALDGQMACAVMKYDNAVKLLKSLLTFTDTATEIINIEPPEWDNYFDEYLISVDKRDDGVCICCEKEVVNGTYLGFDASLLIIASDCHYGIVYKNELPEHCVIEAIISEEADEYDLPYCDDDCDCCGKCCCEDQTCGYPINKDDQGNEDDDGFYCHLYCNDNGKETDFHLNFDQLCTLIEELFS